MEQNLTSIHLGTQPVSFEHSRSGSARSGALVRGMAASLLALALAACGGGGGGSGGTSGGGTITPPDTSASGTAALAAASSLDINVTSVTIASPPVVNFTVTDQAGTGMTGIANTDLRFNIAKLMPGADGGPTTWQNYINRAKDGAVQGSQERSASGFAFGTLTNHGDGTYTYTFATDITNAAANICPAPCTDAAGKKLDISYQPRLTHRVTIQQGNNAYPKASGVYDFVPAGGGVVTKRDIVSTAKCNACHNELHAHGTRVDTKLCVTCHNPGSWVAGTPNTPVDFKVMIHKIHDGPNLPSVLAGTPYVVNGTDFSDVKFPNDVRNCTLCHDGTPGAANATAQGDNWKMAPSRAACGSCHDGIDFATGKGYTIADAQKDVADGKPVGTTASGHQGGAVSDDSTCAMCHTPGKFSGNEDIVVAHNFPTRFKAASAKFQYNIVSVASTAAGSKPVITFSVTDPTNANVPYDIKADPHFTQTANGTSRLAVSIGWVTNGKLDFGNADSGANYGQPISIDALANAVAVGDGTYTVTSTTAVPAGQTGTLRVTIDGHPAGDVTTAGTYSDRLQVKSVYKDVAVSGTVVARRTVVDVAKCDVCHGVLSLHGDNRTDEPGVCVVCHNPNATDKARRPVGVAGEESIDFKRLIHAIHAGEADKGGFRTTGIKVYGFGGSVNDFSDVVFPGNLNDCSNCHIGDSYELTGTWAAPTANGILGSTIDSGASASDPADNLRITPTAAVCTSCHDGAATQTHILGAYQGGNFSATQAAIDAANSENCAFCHGPNGPWSMKKVHGVK